MLGVVAPQRLQAYRRPLREPRAGVPPDPHRGLVHHGVGLAGRQQAHEQVLVVGRGELFVEPAEREEGVAVEHERAAGDPGVAGDDVQRPQPGQQGRAEVPAEAGAHQDGDVAGGPGRQGALEELRLPLVVVVQEGEHRRRSGRGAGVARRGGPAAPAACQVRHPGPVRRPRGDVLHQPTALRVGRVVDDHDLRGQDGLRQHARERLPQEVGAEVRRHHHRDLRLIRHPVLPLRRAPVAPGHGSETPSDGPGLPRVVTTPVTPTRRSS